jgi:transposase
MPHFVGLDVSEKTTRICVMDRNGAIESEGVAETSPKAIVAYLRGHRRRYGRVGLEVGSQSSWLHQGLVGAGLPAVCLEAWKTSRVLETQRNKTDHLDARGIAELVRTGSFHPVHVKSAYSTASWAWIPRERGHDFHGIVGTDSTPSWAPL